MTKKENSTSSWTDPDDAPSLAKDWFAGADRYDGDKLVRRGRPKSEKPKQPVSLRLDTDLIDWFRNSGPGWQTRINDALRRAAGL